MLSAWHEDEVKSRQCQRFGFLSTHSQALLSLKASLRLAMLHLSLMQAAWS
jgi:hypothetical protein